MKRIQIWMADVLNKSKRSRRARTDFDVSILCLHQLIDDLAEFVGVGELSLGGSARCGRQS